MSELVVIRAENDQELEAEINRLIGYIDRVPDARLVDVAYTAQYLKGESVITLIAENLQDLRVRLSSAVSRIKGMKRIKDKSGTYFFKDHLLGPGKGKLAFVYPNAISFYPDMMRDILLDSDACRSAFDELEEAIREEGRDFLPSTFVFPPAAYYRRDADVFASGAYAEALVSVYSGCMAMTRLLESVNVFPDGVVGFAGGDLAAMMRSGVVSEKTPRHERLKLIREAYQVVQKAVKSAGLPEVKMVTVVLRHEDDLKPLLEKYIKGEIFLAVDFSPRQKTLVIVKEYANAVMNDLASAGIRTLELPFNRPINTPMAKPIVQLLKKFCDPWMRRDPEIDFYSCIKADKVSRWRRNARSEIAEQWAQPVLFESTIKKMYADGYRVFLEVGPRGLMSSAIDDTLKGVEHAAIALNSIHRRGSLQLQHAFALFIALGGEADLSITYAHRSAKKLDFDSSLSVSVRKDSEMQLSRAFPRLALKFNEHLLIGESAKPYVPIVKGRGAKAAARALAQADKARRKRQFDFGALNPLLSDADTLESCPGVMVRMSKVFRLSELPFIADFAFGTSQISYSDKSLRGLVVLTPAVGAEIVAEAALIVVPNRKFKSIKDFAFRRMIDFSRDGELKLFIRAERTTSPDPKEVVVRVQIREEESISDNFIWPALEASVVLDEDFSPVKPYVPMPLTKPRNVHWSGRDIYPVRLFSGRRLRGIRFVEAWSESGIDYEVEVPPLEGNVEFSRYPIWHLNPLLLGIITSGFSLWRSHERFRGSFSFPFRFHNIELFGSDPKPLTRLKCYLRLTGVTPKSHIADIVVSDGNGNQLMAIDGWEEITERVPEEYCNLVLQPATAFLTRKMPTELLGEVPNDTASAFVTDIPYMTFERNEEFWLKTLSSIILSDEERKNFAARTGSTSRRTEWLFGRVAAKEAVRRYLKDAFQARWSDADVRIWADNLGKPHAIGEWSDTLSTRLDIAIAHTAQFVIALAVPNYRVGVDVESVERNLSEEFAAGAFSPSELELAAQTINSSHTIIRFWCAKEAVSKALGTGIRFSPKEMVVSEYNSENGSLKMILTGGWIESFKAFKGRYIEVTVRTFRDHAFAYCFIPMSLFDGE